MPAIDFAPEFLAKLDRMSLIARAAKVGKSQGTRRSPKRGSSAEFADFRNYAIGDDLRRIDWNAYARLDRLFLKLFSEEQDTTFHFILDKSGSMTFGEGEKYRFALRVAAALGYIALRTYDRVSVALIGEKLDRVFGPVAGRAAWRNLWGFLNENATPSDRSPTELERSLKQFASTEPARGVSILFSDLLTPGTDLGLGLLSAARQEIVVMQVLGQSDLSPNESGEVRLVDSESGETREISLSPAVLREYRRRMDAHTESVRQYCTARGFGFVRAEADSPVEDFVLRALLSMGLVR